MTFTSDLQWDARPGRNAGDIEIWAGQMHIATVHHAPGMFRREAQANADLIAKAPRMHEIISGTPEYRRLLEMAWSQST